MIFYNPILHIFMYLFRISTEPHPFVKNFVRSSFRYTTSSLLVLAHIFYMNSDSQINKVVVCRELDFILKTKKSLTLISSQETKKFRFGKYTSFSWNLNLHKIAPQSQIESDVFCSEWGGVFSQSAFRASVSKRSIKGTTTTVLEQGLVQNKFRPTNYSSTNSTLIMEFYSLKALRFQVAVHLSGQCCVGKLTHKKMFATYVSRQIGFHTPPPPRKCLRYAPGIYH